LGALAEQFKNNNFDVKYLIRAIVLSDTYQRSSRPAKGNELDAELFSHMPVKVMRPEQLYDSLVTVVGTVRKQDGFKNKPGAKGGPVGPREQFLNFFRIDEGADPLEYQVGIPHALRLMNSPQTNANSALVDTALKAPTPAKGLEYLYLATVSRPPTTEELDRMMTY